MADNFTIESQRQTTELTADGRFVDVMEVTFTTPDGDAGTVRIPVVGYSAAAVEAAVSAQAAEMRKAREL